MITTSQIANEIQSHIDADGTLRLRGDAFGSKSMEAIFAQYLTDDTLIVAGAALQTTEATVTVTGTGGGRFSRLSVTAVFTPMDTDDVLSVSVVGLAPDGWVFPSAFSSLAGGQYESVLVAAGSALQLQTVPAGDAPAGLSFAGSLLVQGLLTGVVSFLNGAAPIPIAGPIDVVSGVPSFSFDAQVRQGLTIGTLTALNFDLNLLSTPYQFDAADGQGGTTPTYTQSAYVALSTTLSFDSKSGPVTVAASMPFSTGVMAGLSVTSDSSLGVFLEAFTDWAGTSLMAGMPPPELFNPADFLMLNDLSFSISLATLGLSAFNVSVGTTDAWTVIPGLITVENVSLTLTSMGPGSGASVTGMLEGTVDLGGAAQIVLNACAPGYTFWGQLQEGTTVDVSALLAVLIPGAQDIPSITLTFFEFACQPATDPIYYISASFASDWVLDVSPVQMAVTNGAIEVDYGPSGDDGSGPSTTTGRIAGSIVFNNSVTFDIAYALPGVFSVRGTIDRIALLESIQRLASQAAIDMPLPSGFDLVFTACSVAICYGTGANSNSLEFQVSATVEGLGDLAFDALKVQGNWNYAAGLSMGEVSVAKVPGLSALEPFVVFFAFKKLVLVVASANLPDFVFPDASVFTGTPANSPVVLPASQGVVEGLNAYADIDLGSQRQLSLLMNFLHVSAELSITLQVGVQSVLAQSALYASLGGTVNSNVIVAGQFGAKFSDGTEDLYMLGSVTTVLQQQKIEFDFTLAFVANGAFLSGGFKGQIDFVIVKLSNLNVEIGIDWEGIPTIGFGAQIDVGQFESSVMILLDSADPAQSMFVASVSDLTLATTLETLCNLTSTDVVPDSLMAVLRQVGLSGTGEFTISDSDGKVAAALNDRDVAAASQAFASAVPSVTLPNDPLEVIITVAKEHSLWYITDMVNILHYRLAKSAAGDPIQGTVEPQLYVVPQATQLGAQMVPQGLRLNGKLDLFGFYASITVEIANYQGFNINAEFSKLVVAVSGYPVFSFTSADGSAGPTISVCTYQVDSTPPHFIADGSLNVLGVIGESVTMNFTETGGTFSTRIQLSSVAEYDLSGSYSNTFSFSCAGSASIGVDQTFDFGQLGQIHFDAAVGYTFSIAVESAMSGQASASGSFSFEGQGFSIPTFTLPLDTSSLADLVVEAAKQVQKILQDFLNDYLNWLNWVGKGVMLGIDSAEQVGYVLYNSFQLAYDTIGTETTAVLNYTADQVADALAGAGATADQTMDVLVNTLSYSTDAAVSAVEQAFTTPVHVDMGVPHGDTIAVPHGDTIAVPHGDTGVPHGDSGIPHGDSGIPHGDSGIPHGDSTITPHSDHKDIGIHWDIPRTHGDTPAIHTDTPEVHTDSPAIHTDVPTTHVDTPAVHADTPAVHADTPSVHTDFST